MGEGETADGIHVINKRLWSSLGSADRCLGTVPWLRSVRYDHVRTVPYRPTGYQAHLSFWGGVGWGGGPT